jgi:hypothetical protein
MRASAPKDSVPLAPSEARCGATTRLAGRHPRCVALCRTWPAIAVAKGQEKGSGLAELRRNKETLRPSRVPQLWIERDEGCGFGVECGREVQRVERRERQRQ